MPHPFGKLSRVFRAVVRSTPVLTAMLADSQIAYSRFRPRAPGIRLSISRFCGVFLAVCGVIVLLGWMLDIGVLTSLAPSWATMKVNTAVSFILCGCAFYFIGGDSPRAMHRSIAIAAVSLVLMIATWTIVEYLLNTSFSVDEILMRQKAASGTSEFPGRMSMATAVCFVLLGTSLLLPLLGFRRGNSLSLLLAWILATISLMAVIGYVYNVRSLYMVWPFSTMALHTAILFGVASVGILGSKTDRSPLGFLAVDRSGSDIARRMLPLAIIGPILIGWLAMRGAHANLYGLQFGFGLVVTAIILSFIAMIWVASTALNRAEALSRNATATLADEATRRRLLFEQVRDGILVLDACWNIHEANESFVTMLGYTPEELENLKPWDWSPDFPDEESFVAAWHRLPAEGGKLETQIMRKDGELVDVGISYSNAELDDTKYVYCIYRDISARKAADRALHESQERFQRALENIPDVVVIYDPDLRIRFINSATRAVTGMETDAFMGRRDDELFPAEVYRSYMPALEDALASKQIRKVDTQLDLPGGGQRSLHITCVPLLDDRGNVREILGITHDYTERQKAEERMRKSEVQYRELVEQAADGIFICDANGNFQLVNSRCCELLGYTREELLRANGRDTYLEEEINVSTERLKKLSSGQDLRYERIIRRKDFSTFPAEVSVKMLDSGRTQVIFHDISSRYAQEKKIDRLSRIHAVLSGINSAIVRIRDRRELFREACRIAHEAGKFRIAWIGGIDKSNGQVRMLAQSGLTIHLDDRDMNSGPIIELVPDGPSRFCMESGRPVYDNDIEHSRQMSRQRRDAVQLGAKSVIALPIKVEGSIFGLMVLYATDRNFFDDEELRLLKELAGDISFALDFIAKNEKVDHLAFYDTLTKLPNRSLFFDALKRQLAAAEMDDEKVVLQLLDIDRFRMINETYGRDEADKLICAIADRISAATSERDTIARVGSDSFAVAISGSWDEARTAHTLDEFHGLVFGEPFVLNQEELRISATSGVAMFPGDGADEQTLLTNAEAAQRKAEKQNVPFLFYSPDMNERVADSIRLENRLRKALELNEFLMWYQPKWSVSSGELTGYEALMRWKDKETGDLVQPAMFIPVLEQTGLILDAGTQAMRKIVGDCGDWAAQGVIARSVAVNVSLLQLRDEEFVASVIEMKSSMQKSGCALEIELTESVVMENIDTIVSKLQTLRDHDVLISIDDFGTGYSSLAYIARLPIHALKIDRSFTSEMTRDKNALTIVKSVISLAHSLNLKVIAEGVESAEQLRMLADLECDEVQGYYFSRPVAAEEVSQIRSSAGT